MPTPSMEDYIEQIYILMEQKGYARVSDIAENLQVHPSSVTKMVQKLDKDEYLKYEKYRGLILTDKGEQVGKRLVYRHELLEDFLTDYRCRGREYLSGCRRNRASYELEFHRADSAILWNISRKIISEKKH